MERSPSALAAPWVQSALIFLASFGMYTVLRTNDYLAVDGALRALGVYHAGRPYVHENNHLLYPVNVYLWSRALDTLGIHAEGPVAFLRTIQAMNGAAAAGCVAILYGLLAALDVRRWIASLAAVGFGLSRAVLVHAVNSAEPLVGLFWSGLAAVCLVHGLSKRRPSLVFVGGLLLALAMATYQSMVLIGIPLTMLAFSWADGSVRWAALRGRWFPSALFVSGTCLGIIGLYGLTYSLSGTQSVAAMVRRFLEVEAGDVYGGASLVKAAAVVPGFAYGLMPVLSRDCDGFRCLYTDQYRSWLPVAGLAVAATLFWAVIALTTVVTLWPTLPHATKRVVQCSGVGLLVTLVPPLLWLPTYDKLWLQPLALWFLLCGVLLGAGIGSAGRGGRRWKAFAWCTVVMVAVISVSNGARVVSACGAPTPHLTEAEEIAAIVGPRDLLVGDWNEMFILYQYFWAPRGNSFNVTTEAQKHGQRTATLLQNRIARTEASGGHVFYLGILDLSPAQWSATFGPGRFVPFDVLDDSRRCAVSIRAYPYRGQVVTLRQRQACG